MGLETLAQQRLAVVGHHQRLRGRVLRLCESLHRKKRQRRQNERGSIGCHCPAVQEVAARLVEQGHVLNYCDVEGNKHRQ